MKKLVLAVSLLVILVAGVIAVTYMQSEIPVTYDGRGTDVYALQQDPESYDVSDPDGAASIIVQENLAKTQAVNNVTAVVFDFRGYDTLGESFVLLIAITGATVILRRQRKRWEGGTAPIFTFGELKSGMYFVDPIPQALTLTSIVIGACVTAMALALCVRIYKEYGTLDAREIRRLHG